jgi:hypothetical protein
MVHELEDRQRQVTVLNFSDRPVAGHVTSQQLPPGTLLSDMFTGARVDVDDDHTFAITLPAHHGTSLIAKPARPGVEPGHPKPHR